MTRATILALGLLAAGTLSVRVARAEPPNSKASPLYVLSVETDDADDQADALTQALRSRTRQAPGWSLAETGQSFGMLSIALKCPSKPDAACLQRIGDQLHADHYMWGTMSRHKPNQVAADMHLWTRGKGDSDTVEVYTDNLKDASDETLKGIAARVFAKLTGGGAASGTLVIHAGTGGGTVLVDGAQRGTLDGGVARVDLSGGAHTVAVRVPGYEVTSQQANVVLGSDQDLTFQLVATGTEQPTPSKPFPGRKVAIYGSIILGSATLIVGGVIGTIWIVQDTSAGSKSNNYYTSLNDRNSVPMNTQVCSSQLPRAQEACNLSNASFVTSLAAILTGSIGAVLLGTGLYLLWTNHDTDESSKSSSATLRPHFEISPAFGPHAASADLRVTF